MSARPMVSADKVLHALELLAEQGGSVGRPIMYSGRGMFGVNCVGVPLDTSADVASLGLNMVAIIVDSEDDGRMKTTDLLELLDEFAELMQDTRTDEFGRGIIAYWPKLYWPEGKPPR